MPLTSWKHRTLRKTSLYKYVRLKSMVCVCVCLYCGIRNVAARAFFRGGVAISVFPLFIPAILSEIQLTIQDSQYRFFSEKMISEKSVFGVCARVCLKI